MSSHCLLETSSWSSYLNRRKLSACNTTCSPGGGTATRAKRQSPTVYSVWQYTIGWWLLQALTSSSCSGAVLEGFSLFPPITLGFPAAEGLFLLDAPKPWSVTGNSTVVEVGWMKFPSISFSEHGYFRLSREMWMSGFFFHTSWQSKQCNKLSSSAMIDKVSTTSSFQQLEFNL